MKTYKDDRIQKTIESCSNNLTGNGSVIILDKQKFIKFKSKTLTELKPEFVYTLGVEEDHSYNVEGLICENCFLLSMEDKLEDMYECVKRGALISKFSGGIGINISMLRPKGSRIHSTGGKSDGVVPFFENSFYRWKIRRGCSVFESME
jgi:hypothetical protein